MQTNSQVSSRNKLDKEELRSYLIELITLFREELKKLSTEEQAAASRTLEDLSPLCQIMIIWARDPEFQVVIIAHLKELEDKLIEIHGPIENSNLLDYIENQILNSDFIKLIGRDEIENFLANQLRYIQNLYNPLQGSLRPIIDGKTRIFDKPYVVGWLVRGNLLNFDVKEVVDNCIKNIISIAKPSPPFSSVAPPPEEKTILKGFGAYVYPPIWIGEVPKPKSFKDKVIGVPFWIYSLERVITGTYKGYPLIVTRDGYLAIGIKEKSKALEHLNEIMSTLLLLKIPTYVIREADLDEVEFKEMGVFMTQSPVTARAWLYNQQLLTYPPLPLQKMIVNEEKIKKAIKWSEIITNDERIKTLILLFHETYTYFMNTEYKQALVMGWIILEDFYIKNLWRSHVEKITSDKNRLNKLVRWNVDKMIETLHIFHVLTNAEYDLLMKIKDARNKVVHEGKTPKKEIVEKCLELVSNVIQKYIEDYVGAKLSEL